MIKRAVFLIAGDTLAALVALSAAYLIRFGSVSQLHDFSYQHQLGIFMFVAAQISSSFLVELYALFSENGKKELAVRIIISIVVSFFILTAIFYLSDFAPYGRGVLAIALIMFALLQFSWHSLYRILYGLPWMSRRVLVLGTGPLARQIGNLIEKKKLNYQLAGYVNCSSEPVMVPYHCIINSENGLLDAIKNVGAHKIVVSLSERRGMFPLQEMLSCKLSGIEVVDAPSFYEQMTGKLLLENITPSWFIFSHGFQVTFALRALKRMVDISSALIGLLFTFPVFPIIALCIKLDSPGPIFFRQVRVGERDRPFTLLKFRSMRQDAEKKSGAVWAVENDPRVTRFGEFLRKSRIDEIPQLLNVFRGDMSLVGPRPERPEFVGKLKAVIPYYSERHYVKPGVTGWAQVSYPYGASVEDAIEKLRYDLYYIKNISLPFDILIILETIKVVLFRRGSR